MAKQNSKKVEQRAWLLKIEDVAGWILVCQDEDSPDWHIAWLDPFGTKKRALAFAATHNWSKPYRAVRGRVTTR